ncbi:MAG: molecular chaperone HtpG, partial [Muribaculaceae bacterium]|nr:molecular chaperone HtpG [Muribaculaceae bacterium]
EKLDKLFTTDRSEFEKKWDDIRIFIVYGMLTDEKFCDAAMKFMLLRDTEGRYFTPEEYKTLVESSQTNADGKIVYLYATDATAQYNYIKAANDKGYNVLLLDGQLDNHFVGLLERKFENTELVRVDSDVIDNLIRKSDRRNAGLTPVETAILSRLFEVDADKVEKASFGVQFEALSPDSQPIVLTQNEYMRRMKEMAALQPGMNFYGELPDSYSLVVNTEHPLVKSICERADKALGDVVKPLLDTIDEKNAQADAIRKAAGSEPLSAENEQRIKDLEKEVEDVRAKQSEAIAAYASQAPEVSQLVDLALLGNGLLRGRSLSDFIARSISMMK